MFHLRDLLACAIMACILIVQQSLKSQFPLLESLVNGFSVSIGLRLSRATIPDITRKLVYLHCLSFLKQQRFTAQLVFPFLLFSLLDLNSLVAFFCHFFFVKLNLSHQLNVQ